MVNSLDYDTMVLLFVVSSLARLAKPARADDDWDEAVYADSIEEAWQKCEALQRTYNGDRSQVILSNVRKANRNPHSRTYLCIWTPVR